MYSDMSAYSDPPSGGLAASSLGFINSDRGDGFASSPQSPPNDPVAMFKSTLTLHDLLSPDHENALAHQLSLCAFQITLITLIFDPSAKDLVQLIKDARDSAVKKRYFSTESQYFTVRKQVDDLRRISTDKGSGELTLLADAIQTSIHTDRFFSLDTIELIADVEWPGPLVIALAGRYCSSQLAYRPITQALNNYLCVRGGTQKYPVHFSAEQEKIIQEYSARYLDARDTLVKHNLRLVFHIAKRYTDKPEQLADLVQEGTLGLIRAAEKYSLKSGCRFSTYAHQWIDSKIREARVNIDKLMPISMKYNNDLLRLSKQFNQLNKQGGRTTLHAVAKASGLNEGHFKSLMQLKPHAVSLDTPLDAEERFSLHSMLPDPKSNIAEKISKEKNAKYVTEMMARVLTERECYIINERFGRLNSDPKTLKELSDILNLSRERVRQLESEALKKLASSIDPDMLDNEPY